MTLFFVRQHHVFIVDTFYRSTKLLDRSSPACGNPFYLVQRAPLIFFFCFNVTYKPGQGYRVPPAKFRLLMQSCRFFPPDLFMKVSNFSKTVHTISIKILQSFYTQRGPVCAKASKSYVENIAKISPKWPNSHFSTFFRFSQNLSIRFERNFLQSFYTILESYMCNGIKIAWLGCENHSQN